MTLNQILVTGTVLKVSTGTSSQINVQPNAHPAKTGVISINNAFQSQLVAMISILTASLTNALITVRQDTYTRMECVSSIFNALSVKSQDLMENVSISVKELTSIIVLLPRIAGNALLRNTLMIPKLHAFLDAKKDFTGRMENASLNVVVEPT